jgi:hypothetical protein
MKKGFLVYLGCIFTILGVVLILIASCQLSCTPIEMNLSLSEMIGEVPDELYGIWRQKDGPVSYHFYEDRSFDMYRYSDLVSSEGRYWPLSTSDSVGLSYDYTLDWTHRAEYYKFTVCDTMLVMNHIEYKRPQP